MTNDYYRNLENCPSCFCLTRYKEFHFCVTQLLLKTVGALPENSEKLSITAEDEENSISN